MDQSRTLVLPHNVEAERAVLGAVLIDGARWADVCTLPPKAFHRRAHRVVFRAMAGLVARGVGADLVTVKDELQRVGTLDEAGGPAAIASLVDGVPKSTRVVHYAQVLREHLLKREVVVAAYEMVERASNGATVVDLSTRAESLLELARLPREAEVRQVSLAEVLRSEPEPVPWVIPGWLAGRDLACLAGESGHGKSLVALDLAIALAREGRFLGRLQVRGGPYRVLYVDEENGPHLVRHRLRRMAAGLGIDQQESEDLSIHYFHENGFSLVEPARKAQFMGEVTRLKPDVIILDALIRFTGGLDENSNSAMSEFFTDSLKPLMTEHGATVVVVHHLAKPSKDRPGDVGNRLRGASDLRAQLDELWGLERDSQGGLTLSQFKCRWQQPARPIGIEIEGTECDEWLRLVGSEACIQDLETQIVALLDEAETSGLLRAELIEALEEKGMRSAEKLATKYLGRLHSKNRVTKDGKRPTRYWLQEHCPQTLLVTEP